MQLRRAAVGDRRPLRIFHDAEHGRHGDQARIGRRAVDELDNGRAEAPDIGRRQRPLERDDLGRHCGESTREAVRRSANRVGHEAGDALQFGVPFASLVEALKPRVALMAFRLSDTPKSESLMLPCFVVRMLAAAKDETQRQNEPERATDNDRDSPLRSQCTTPCP